MSRSSHASFIPLSNCETFVGGRKTGLAPCFVEQRPCRQAKLSNARPYYNKARQSIYNRFSNCEWDAHNAGLKCLADNEVCLARRIKDCAWAEVDEASRITKNRHVDNKIRLADRIRDVDELRRAEVEERDLMEEAIENLKNVREQLVYILEELKIAQAVGEESMMRREGKVSMEQILDQAEVLLTQEVIHLRNSRIFLKDFFDMINDQLARSRDAQLALVADIRDKENAQMADINAYRLQLCSKNINHRARIESYAPVVTDEKGWLEFGSDLLGRSECERCKTDQMRENVRYALDDERRKMQNYVDSVSNSLNNRIAAVGKERCELEAHLRQVDAEIVELEKTVNLVKCSVEEKRLNIKLVRSKIHERTFRYCTENVRDQAYIGFKAEAEELQTTISCLEDKLRCLELSLCRLAKTRLRLISDIKAKHCSMQVDSTCALPLHQALQCDMPIHETARLLCANR